MRSARLAQIFSSEQGGKPDAEWCSVEDFPPTSIKLQNREAYFSALEEYAIQENLAPFDTLLRENMEREMDAFFTMYAQHIDLAELRQTYPTLAPLAASYIDDAY